MSDPLMEIIREQQALARRMGQTEVRETPLYATGTWTPTYLGSTTPGDTTYSVQQGAYVRIGKIVVATGSVVWTAATGTGNAQVSLPFTGAAGLAQSGSIRLVNVTFAAGTPQAEFAGTPYFQMRSPATNAGGTLVQMEAAGNIVFTIVYLID